MYTDSQKLLMTITSMLLCFFFVWGISVCSWGCSLESAADSLPSCLDYTPVAVHLLFAGRLNGSCFFIHGDWRHCKTHLGNDFVTCSLCVKSHVKYSVFWMELCFSSKLLLTVTVCFGWNLTAHTLSEDIVSEKWKNPRIKKLQSCLPCKRNLEFIL